MGAPTSCHQARALELTGAYHAHARFLLFCDERYLPLYDIKIFLRVSKETCRQRRLRCPRVPPHTKDLLQSVQPHSNSKTTVVTQAHPLITLRRSSGLPTSAGTASRLAFGRASRQRLTTASSWRRQRGSSKLSTRRANPQQERVAFSSSTAKTTWTQFSDWRWSTSPPESTHIWFAKTLGEKSDSLASVDHPQVDVERRASVG